MKIINIIKRQILFSYYSLFKIFYIYRRLIELRNFKKISLNNYILGVWDLKAIQNPFSIGDFIAFLFFLKCFIIYKKNIKIILICDSQKKLNKFQIKFLRLKIKFTHFFLSDYLESVKIYSWANFKKKNFAKHYIPFKTLVMQRKDYRDDFVSFYNIMLIPVYILAVLMFVNGFKIFGYLLIFNEKMYRMIYFLILSLKILRPKQFKLIFSN